VINGSQILTHFSAFADSKTCHVVNVLGSNSTQMKTENVTCHFYYPKSRWVWNSQFILSTVKMKILHTVFIGFMQQ